MLPRHTTVDCMNASTNGRAVAPEEQLPRLGLDQPRLALGAFGGNRVQQHHDQQRPHPQRQRGVQRRHGRAEVLHREHGDALHPHRSGHRLGERLGVRADNLLQLLHVSAGQRLVDALRQRRHLVGRPMQLIGHGTDGALRARQGRPLPRTPRRSSRRPRRKAAKRAPKGTAPPAPPSSPSSQGPASGYSRNRPSACRRSPSPHRASPGYRRGPRTPDRCRIAILSAAEVKLSRSFPSDDMDVFSCDYHGIHRGAVLLVELRLRWIRAHRRAAGSALSGHPRRPPDREALCAACALSVSTCAYTSSMAAGTWLKPSEHCDQRIGQGGNRRRQRIADGVRPAFRPRCLLLRVPHRVLRIAQKMG